MQFKGPFKAASAIALLALAGAAQATTSWNLGSYTVTYDDTTPGFLTLAGAFTAGGGLVGFNWNVQPAVLLSTGNGSVSSVFALPDFTITANPGFVLSGPLTGSLGNVTYAEFGDGLTKLSAGATVLVDAGPAVTTPLAPVTKVATSATTGYFAQSVPVPLGTFNTFTLSGGTLKLEASASLGSFAAIIGQTQNQLRFEFYANEVPEPQTYALFAAGIGLLGWVARRRRVG
jgi:hypothetical protein